MTMKPNTGRKQAQRRYPIAPDDRCDACGGIKTLQRHHKDHDPSNNSPENIAILCRTCHALEHKTVKPANCEICGTQFQPLRSRRKGRVLCKSQDCLKEMGRRSAELRWASRRELTDLQPSATGKYRNVQPLRGAA